MDIRLATATDFEQLWPVLSAFPNGIEPVRAVAERSLASIRAHPGAALLVAHMGGAIVGYVLVFDQPTLFADGPAAYVQELMVDEPHRNEGVGGALMASAENWARERGCRSIRLVTSRAGAFYLARGYEEASTFFKKSL